MIFRTLFYYIEKLLIVIATCIVACLLFILIAYLPFKKVENIWMYSFFEGTMGIFLYLLPLFIIWFFPIACYIDSLTFNTKLDRIKALQLQLYSGIVLAFVFTFIFDNFFNVKLFLVYFLISFLTSVIFYYLNMFGNRLLKINLSKEKEA